MQEGQGRTLSKDLARETSIIIAVIIITITTTATLIINITTIIIILIYDYLIFYQGLGPVLCIYYFI